MKRRMSLLLVGLLLVLQIMQGIGFAGVAQAAEVSPATEQTAVTIPSGAEPTNSVDSAQTGSEQDGSQSETQTPGDTHTAPGDSSSTPGDSSTTPTPGETSPAPGSDTGTAPGTEEGQGEAPSAPDQEAPAKGEGEGEAVEKPKSDAEETAKPTVELEAKQQRNAQAITDNLLTDAELKIRNGAGDYLPVEQGVVYEQGAEVEVDYKWSIPNGHDYQANDWFEFDLPDKFVLANDVKGDLITQDGTVGQFVVDRSTFKVKMTFNEEIEQFEDVQGTIQILTKFDKSKFSGGTTQTILLPIPGQQKEVTLEFRPAVSSAMDKSGAVDRAFNGKHIQWTVDFNKTMQSVNDAVLNDPMPAGLIFDEASLKVYQLDVQLDGSVKQGALFTDYTLEKNTTGEGFALKFNASPIHSAYRVVYSTDVESGNSFTNKATFIGSNMPEVTAQSTQTVTTGKLLDKQMLNYNSEKQQVDWRVYYNYGEKNISASSAVLTDLFNGSHELVGGTAGIKVYLVTPTSDRNLTGKTPYTDFDVKALTDASGKNGFELKFNSDIDSAYVIEYSTKASKPVYTSDTIVNTVTESGGESARGEAQTQTGQVFGIKTYVDSQKDYINKEAGWQIVLNHNKLPMKGVTITDTFPYKGLSLLPNTLSITGPSGELKLGEDYTLAPLSADVNDYSQGFKIDFGADRTLIGEYKVTYRTHFDVSALDAGKSSFLNRAIVAWTDEENNPQSVTTEATFNPNTETKNNGYKNGTYNAVTKKITWTVGVNYNLQNLASAAIVDKLTVGQTPDMSSLKLYTMNIAKSGGISRGSEAAIGFTPTYDEATRTLTVSFNQPINAGYILVFDTSLDGNLIESNKVLNTAMLMNGADKVSSDLKAEAKVENGGEYVEKSGAQNGELMNWTIWINRSQSTVSGAQLTDKPSANQVLLRDSFNLYKTNVAANGTVTKGSEKLQQGADKDYTLQFTTDDKGKETFVLKFNKEIATSYVLEYQSMIDAKNGDTVSNIVDFNGFNLKQVQDSDSEDKVVAISSGSGTGSGVRYQLTVHKVDADDKSLSLPGAEFTLQRKLKSGPPTDIGTAVTDEKGQIVFTKLLSGTYILKEKTAPEGYEVDPTERVVEIKSANAVDSNVNLEVTNKRAYQLIVHKVDADNAALSLEGAEFTLERKQKDGSRLMIETAKTNKQGQITFTKLLSGNYILKEKSAPAGYQLDPKEYELTLDRTHAGDDLILEQEIGNVRTYGLTVHKVDADNNKLSLKGAEFTLERKEADGSRLMIAAKQSDEQGLLTFEGLVAGDYILTEKSAPTGYQLDAAEHEVKIGRTEAGEDFVVDETVTNKKLPSVPVDPQPPVDPEPPVTPPAPPVTPTPPTPPVETPGESPLSPPTPPVTPPTTSVDPTPPTTPTPGLQLPNTPLPTPLIDLPEDGSPSGSPDVEPTPTPTPSTPVNNPQTPVVPTPTPTPTPDEGIDIGDETPRGGLDIPSDPSTPSTPSTPSEPSIDTPDETVPQGTTPPGTALLPQTGESDYLANRIVGFGLLFIGLFGVLLVRKRTADSNKTKS